MKFSQQRFLKRILPLILLSVFTWSSAFAQENDEGNDPEGAKIYIPAYLHSLKVMILKYEASALRKKYCAKTNFFANKLERGDVEPPALIPTPIANACSKRFKVNFPESFIMPDSPYGSSPENEYDPQWQLVLKNWNYVNNASDWKMGLRRAWRVLSGELAASTTKEVGSFIIHWDAGKNYQLSVFHKDSPGKVLWQTKKGRSFIKAAAGEDTVSQWRGSLTIIDKPGESLCGKQSIDAIEQVGNTVVFDGRLSGVECDIAYQLKFHPESEHRLGFEISVNDQGDQSKVKAPIDRIFLEYQSWKDEKFFGFGEQFTHFNLKGKKVPVIAQEQGHLRGAPPWSFFLNRISPGSAGDWHTTYTSIPQYVTSHNRSLFLENLEYSLFDLSRNDGVEIRVWANKMKGQIVNGRTPLDLVSRFTEYTGRMKVLPDWVHSGAIIGIMGGSDRTRKIWGRLRVHGAPIASFWLQDWVGKRDTGLGIRMWWNWEQDKTAYPTWKGLVRQMERSDIRVLGYINPFLSDVSEKEHYERNLFLEAKDLGYLTKYANGDLAEVDSGGFTGNMVDFSNPNAREWYKQAVGGAMKEAGLKGWMADFGESLPFDAAMHNGESGEAYHNKYIEEWAKVNQEMIQEMGLDDEGIFFFRTAAGKSHGSVPLYWLGDQLASWDKHDGLASSITGLLSGGVSGMAINHGDIGGLIGMRRNIVGIKLNISRDEELFLRWAEMTAFTPVYRTHEGNNPKTNHQFYSRKETMAGFAYHAKVFAALFDYRKTLLKEAAELGYPMVRHPWMHFPHDEVLQKQMHQFMLGEDFFVSPVIEAGQTSKKVYLPKGKWVHIWSDKVLGSVEEGTWVTVDAPVGQPPVFYKEGSEAGIDFSEKLGKIVTPEFPQPESRR